MSTPEIIYRQVGELTSDLIALSMCNHQKYPSMKDCHGGIREIGFGNDSSLSVVLKNLPYSEIYKELERAQLYNIKMIDGALIQLMYRFHKNKIENHRLAFFPSPYLEEYQNDPETYESDERYAEIIMKNIVPFPLRFDFDSDIGKLDHSKAHLSLGQYKNCRISVSAPLTPYHFISFLLCNFYNTAYRKFHGKLTLHTEKFSSTILKREQNLIYVQIP